MVVELFHFGYVIEELSINNCASKDIHPLMASGLQQRQKCLSPTTWQPEESICMTTPE